MGKISKLMGSAAVAAMATTAAIAGEPAAANPRDLFDRCGVVYECPPPNPPACLPSRPCAWSAYDRAVHADRPVAFYPLADGGRDLSGNARHGRVTGSLATAVAPNGEVASVFSEGNYVTVDHQDAFSVATTGELTLEAWMRPDTLEFSHQEGEGYVHWLGKGASNQMEYAARMYSRSTTRPNRVSGYVFNPTSPAPGTPNEGVGSYFQLDVRQGEDEAAKTACAAPVDTDSWEHVVIVINTADQGADFPMGDTEIYRNGHRCDRDSLADLDIVPSTGSAPFRIGTRDLRSSFQGALAKVAVYDRELTGDEIREHFDVMTAPRG